MLFRSSLGILFGLSIFAIAITILVDFPFSDSRVRDYWIGLLESFSPLDFVLVAILLCVGRVNSVGFWNTVVMSCIAINWAGVSFLLSPLQS